MRTILAKINILANAFEKDGNIETAELLHDVFIKISKKKKKKSSGKNVPNNPSLWASCQAWAKKTYDTHPSAYSNAGAARRYKQKGGTWRKASVNNTRLAQEVFQTEAEKFPEVVQISDEFYKAISSQDYDGAKELLEEMRNFNVNANTPELKNKTQQMLTFMTQSYNEALKRRTFKQDPQVNREQEDIAERDAVRGEENFTYQEVIQKLKKYLLEKKFNEAVIYLNGQLTFNSLFENPHTVEALYEQYNRIKFTVLREEDYSSYERFYLLARKILERENLPRDYNNLTIAMKAQMKRANEPYDNISINNFVRSSLSLQNKKQIKR
jgi:hypothetical protein